MIIKTLLTLLLMGLLAIATPPPCDKYPIYWDVYGLGNYSDIAIEYGIRAKDRTQTGNACATKGCSAWTQGKWPTIDDSGTPINGGVPQAADLDAHLAEIERTMPHWLPDPDWDGNAVLDFEAWTSVYEMNTGSGNWHSKRYPNYSKDLVRKQHPEWSEAQVIEEASKVFTSAATNWMVQTLKKCSELRPKAKWGYYGFPQNYAICNATSPPIACGFDMPVIGPVWKHYSDLQQPLFDASQALYPSIYMFHHTLTSDQQSAYVRSIVHEAERLADASPHPDMLVIPFMMQEYHEHDAFLNQVDLKTALTEPYLDSADGLVIWGHYSALNTTFERYIQQNTGPFVQKLYEVVCHK